uniref:Uncharacterized protein n=1 Tax=Kalanchoe fedtschenkoi TaxID=63787 RepID=A0A7N0UGX4_KALFE
MGFRAVWVAQDLGHRPLPTSRFRSGAGGSRRWPLLGQNRLVLGGVGLVRPGAATVSTLLPCSGASGSSARLSFLGCPADSSAPPAD